MTIPITRIIFAAVLAVAVYVPAAHAQGMATVSGRVTDAATGQPLAGIHVRVVPEEGFGPAAPITGATGEYAVSVVPGTYYVSTINTLHYVNETFGGQRCTAVCIDRGSPLSVVAGEHATVDFALDPGATIAGRVVDAATGAGVTTSVNFYDGKRLLLGSIGTELSGHFLIDGGPQGGLATGTYFLGVPAPPGGYVGELHSDVICAPECRLADATPLRVVAPQSLTGIVVALQKPAGAIAGRVTDAATGQPLGGVRVSAIPADSRPFAPEEGGFSDLAGYYLIEGLPPGTYHLYTNSPPGYIPMVFPDISVVCGGDCRRESRTGTSVSIAGGQTISGISFAMRRGGSISGRVSHDGTAAPATAFVSASTASGIFAGNARPAADGTYIIDALPPGRYFVRVSVSWPIGSFVQVYGGPPCANSACSGAAGTPVTVPDSAVVNGIDFEIPLPSRSVSGTVRAAATGELLSARVTLYLGTHEASTRSGFPTYSFPNVAPGAYRVKASAPGYIDEWFDNGCVICGETGSAVIVGSDNRSGIDFNLEAASKISGRITSLRASNFTVEALRSDGTVAQRAVASTGSRDGTYTIDGLPPGTYFVRATARMFLDGGLPSHASPDQLYDGVPCAGVDCPLTAATAVTVGAGAVVSEINFTMDEAPAVISGRIYKEGETLLGGFAGVSAQVKAFTVDGREAGQFKSSYSGYTIVDLHAGTYYLRTVGAQASGYADQIYKDLACAACSPTSGTPVTVAAGTTRTGIDFMLLPGGTIEGSVHDNAGAPLDNVTVTAHTAGGVAVASAASDRLGTFIIPGLGAGAHYVATSNTQGYVDEVYDDVACGTCDPSRGRAVPVTGGDTTSGIAFSLTRGALVSGTVVDSGGLPRAGVPVMIFDAAGALVARVASGAGGQYVANTKAGTSYAKAGGVDGLRTALYRAQPCPDGRCDPLSGSSITAAVGETVRGIDFAPGVCTPLGLGPVTLAAGAEGALYGGVMTVAGGTGVSHVAVSSGSLPPGLALDSAGTLGGTPTRGGRYTFTVNALDSTGCGAVRIFTLDIASCRSALFPGGPLIFDVTASANVVSIPRDASCAAEVRFNSPWLTSHRDSGSGNLDVAVAANPGGRRTGTFSVGTRVITVNQGVAESSGPFGALDVPSTWSTVAGSIAVAGWALDDLRVVNVSIMRAPVAGEGEALVFIGNAVFVPGARPDVEALYQEFPYAGRAGFGYLLLTNTLPDGGNGTFTLFAIAHDAEGRSKVLGTTTIHASNRAATAPFGAIDTPAQGETISGSSYINFGWALTPQPKTIPRNGSTLSVLVDGAAAGRISYGHFRADVAGIFPGLNNSNGAIGFSTIDTTALADGLHTIAWIVTDDTGAAEGIGSRYFTVDNSGAASPTMAMSSEGSTRLRAGPPTFIEAAPLEQLELDLDELMPDARQCTGAFTGFENVLGDRRPLPVGSTLDGATGRFSWVPGPAFTGRYRFTFSRDGCAGVAHQATFEIDLRR